jgi:hypothetical protein
MRWRLLSRGRCDGYVRRADNLVSPVLWIADHGPRPAIYSHNEIRTHLSLEKDAPISRAVELAGTFFAAQFSAGYTTHMSGFDLRQAH